ncbi:MAG TPA: hypothetical protein VNJ01_06710 [Bacteriovoracaceae bacterium]|nr:hypothetical protein [Bacteriovoracaceae bacterium]
MKEIIQNSKGEVAIVIYDAPLPPKYFRFTKKFIRTLFLTVPLLLLFSFLGLFFWGLGSRLRDVKAPSFPSVLSESDRRIQQLEEELKSEQDSNSLLSEKLSAQAPVASDPDRPFLFSIKEPYGMQNLTSAKKVTVGQVEFIQEAEKSVLKFQITNSGQETKISGHVIVYLLSDTGVLAYPREATPSTLDGVKFSVGETFSVSRLRPTIAEFGRVQTSAAVKFVIYIFTREGDLLLIHQTDSFKAGAKP